ncbi:Uma2 family endonuclease [Synechococcales cyanobacterium C]|uniref:Uma2 family endonuclease n=2 Tax=Petrachloros TaxID=2918834 RepID=A0A8K1ZVL4_9CYAN|nr:Uma2 family endonuclease [Petrachloros mirabilis]NCJ05939.1 Uma2 family endonuclease [Petrachloros mirabilis ULC683]
MNRSPVTQVPTETWVTATWDDYLRALEDPACEKAKSYYYNGQMRIEMSPVGNDHSRDHSIVIHAVYLFAGLREIDLDGHDNCTYRKTGVSDVQPDVSFYIGETAEAIPWGTGIVDLNQYPPPPLIVEVANTSLADDKGNKRLLYEELGVSEYWIIDVQHVKVIAFAVENSGSRRIRQSQVLPGLEISLLEEAFQRTRQMNHGKVSAWLLAQWQG